MSVLFYVDTCYNVINEGKENRQNRKVIKMKNYFYENLESDITEDDIINYYIDNHPDELINKLIERIAHKIYEEIINENKGGVKK